MRTCYTTLLLLFPFLSFSQPVTLYGKVLTGEGTPIAGIFVQYKNTRSGTITNNKGLFGIAVAVLPATLVFSGTGYEPKEYPVARKDSAADIMVTLNPAKARLEEVVVAGYGTSRKEATGYSEISAGRKFQRLYGVKVTGRSMRPDGAATTRGTSSPVTSDDKAPVRGTPFEPMKNTRASLLTAGELSDFKKWKLWADYTADEFKSWSSHWGLVPRQRYCVQLQNPEHKAIAGQAVYLLNSTSDTVWSAVTDNTGKAELWAAFTSGEEKEGSTYSLACGGIVLRSPLVFENGINRITLKQGCTASGTVDIAFVVDATGSMADEIRYLQAELADVISTTTARFPDVRFRLGAVFYRDHGDEYLTRHLPLQPGAAPLLRFIKEQSAGGGGDTPEAVDAALATALDSLQWSNEARARLLFLVLDAPPHDAARDRMNTLIRRAAARGIRIVPVVCSGIDKSAEYLMRCIALATNGSYVFLTDDSGIGNPHIRPTTDEFKVELLSTLLGRLIAEMIYLPPCAQRDPVQPVTDSANNILKVLLYPNPTRGPVTITAGQSLTEIFLTDFTGKMLLRIASPKGGRRWEADLGNYPSGTYLVKYFVEGRGWGTEKVVLLH